MVFLFAWSFKNLIAFGSLRPPVLMDPRKALLKPSFQAEKVAGTMGKTIGKRGEKPLHILHPVEREKLDLF